MGYVDKQLNEKKASLSWKVQELENLNLESGEWEKLSIDHKKLGQMSCEQIILNIKRVLIYHFLCEAVADNEETSELKLLDGLKFPSGGRAVTTARGSRWR